MMVVSWVALLLGVGVLALLLGGPLVLLASPRTRVAGVILTTILAMMVACGVAIFAIRVQKSATAESERSVVYREMERGARVVPLTQSGTVRTNGQPTERVVLELPINAGTPGDNPKKASSVLRILANALIKALEQQEGGLAEEAAKSAAATTKKPSPPDRPEWVESEPHMRDGVYRMSIVVGPYLTLDECLGKLPEELQKAVAQYAENRLGPEAAAKVRLPADYLEDHLVRDRWEERKEYSVGPMMRLHVLLGFDRQLTERLREEWDKQVVTKRIWDVGIVGVMLLLTLSTVYAYLQSDLATAGRYRGRLRFAAGLALGLILVIGLRLVA
jgi:hypothetical protein